MQVGPICRYRVGFDEGGKILALDLDLYNNGGQTADLSLAVMERGISHADNAYFIPNVHVRGHVCKTNLPSNTAFRGFGAPQAMFVAETIVDKVSEREREGGRGGEEMDSVISL